MKKLKRIILSMILLVAGILIALFLNGNIDIGPVFFINRSDKIMKTYLPEDFTVRKNNNRIIAKDCQGVLKGTYDCKQIYRKSVWQNSSGDVFDVWAVFQNQKGKISLSNLAVSPAESVVDAMEKIDNGDWDSFEILMGSGYEWIDGFFHGGNRLEIPHNI